jgi:hypothetical protein
MTADEYVRLVGDIRQNGLHEPIWIFEGKILDGRNRYRACGVIDGVEPAYRYFSGSHAEAAAFVVSMNVHRRHQHLTQKQKNELIEQVLKASPEKSDHRIANELDVSHPTVAKVRKKAEAAGDVESFSTRTDTKGRKQPSSKPPKAKTAKKPTAPAKAEAPAATGGPTAPSPAAAIHEAQVSNVEQNADFMPLAEPEQPGKINALMQRLEAIQTRWEESEDRCDALQKQLQAAKSGEQGDVSLLQQQLRDTQTRLEAAESERDWFQARAEAARSGEQSLADVLRHAIAVVNKESSWAGVKCPKSGRGSAINQFRVAANTLIRLATPKGVVSKTGKPAAGTAPPVSAAACASASIIAGEPRRLTIEELEAIDHQTARGRTH